MKANRPRNWDGIAQWVVTLDTGRFGDWVIVETNENAVEDDVMRKLTRVQRKKATSIRRTLKTTREHQPALVPRQRTVKR